MSKFYSIAALALLLSSLTFAARSNTSAIAGQGATIAMQEQSEVMHVEKLFSGGHWTHPAPITWSSRLDIRWDARWGTSGEYAV